MKPSPRAPERIVSLLASGTELVCALGLGDKLVGRSHECDHPEWVKRLPQVSRPTFDVTGSSHDIDELVRQRLHAGDPLYVVDEALLTSLAPDVVITQTHCEVCAVSPANLAHGGAPRLVRERVVALHASTLDGILDDFMDVARVLARVDAGRALVERERARLAAVEARTRSLERPRVVCLEWADPVFAMSNWGPELVEFAGGENTLGAPGAHSTTIPWNTVADVDPDVLVLAPCGFGLERALREMPLLERQPRWGELRAVKEKRVFVADGNLYFNRSGPSVFETAEILAEILHPGAFPPEHEGRAWKSWG